MRFAAFTLVATVLVTSTMAIPTHRPSKRVNVFQDVIVFDAPAFQNPANPAETLASMQSFVFLRQLDLGVLASGVESALEALGFDVGDAISGVMDRLRLFAAIGLPGQEVKVDVNGCSTQAALAETSGLPDLGLFFGNVALGQCGAGDVLSASVDVSSFDTRTFTADIFPSPPDGFGIISDIDDTIKISNVLDKIQLIQSTLFDEPKAVDGMPELYASLSASLNNPQFIYVTGSPFQLFPFLRDFISTSYAATRGPILMQNLTLVDIEGLLDFAGSNGVETFKLDMVDRVQAMYPAKKFVTIGDSTQADPEVYGESFRKHGGDFIACIWIRLVDGANNVPERFAAAFQGVPAGRTRTFTDAEIPSMQNINVAGGEC